MNIVLLGVGIGLATLIPPGPISITLVQVGARLGHQPAFRGALGIMSGDALLAVVALAIVGAGSALPQAAFTGSQIAAAVVVLVLGLALVVRPGVAASQVDRIKRPGRTLFLLTSFTPSALGSWIALLAAMPFAGDQRQLGNFAIGVVIASFLWHPILGALSSTLGARLSDKGQQRLSRFGGAMMGLIGTALVVQQVA